MILINWIPYLLSTLFTVAGAWVQGFGQLEEWAALEGLQLTFIINPVSNTEFSLILSTAWVKAFGTVKEGQV